MTRPVAVVLARGLGTRMRKPAAVSLRPDQAAVADQGLKAMIPVGRPFLDFVLDSLANAGVAEVGIVIGPEHDLIRRRYQDELHPERLTIRFAIQRDPRGTADAVLAAEAFVADRPFLVVNADNLYPVTALARLVEADGPALIGYRRDALIEAGNIDADRIARFALVWSDAAGRLARIVEKPDPALAGDPTALVSMNSWRFSPAIFDAARAIAPSVRGELELQDAVRWAVERAGVSFEVIPYAGGVLDLSSRADIESVAERLAGVEVRL